MSDVPVRALAKALFSADDTNPKAHGEATYWNDLAAAALAWVGEQLNDEALREAVADATKGWHPLRASDAPVVSAALAAVRAKFGASDE